MTPTTTAFQLAFRKFWDDLTKQGDPALIPNKVMTGFRGGWEAALASHAPSEAAIGTLREALTLIDGEFCMYCSGSGNIQRHDPGCRVPAWRAVLRNAPSEAAAQPTDEVFAEIDKCAAKRAEIEHNDH